MSQIVFTLFRDLGDHVPFRGWTSHEFEMKCKPDIADPPRVSVYEYPV